MLTTKQKQAIEIAVGSHDQDTSISHAVAGAAAMQSIVAIADPSSATAEDCANKINEMLAAVKNG